MDEDRIKEIAKEYADGCQLSRGNVIARLAIEDAFVSGTRLILSDVPTGPCETGIAKQNPSAKNRKPVCHDCAKPSKPLDINMWPSDVWLCNRCFNNRVIRRAAVKAVAADTKEECETASQAHTGTKD